MYVDTIEHSLSFLFIAAAACLDLPFQKRRWLCRQACIKSASFFISYDVSNWNIKPSRRLHNCRISTAARSKLGMQPCTISGSWRNVEWPRNYNSQKPLSTCGSTTTYLTVSAPVFGGDDWPIPWMLTHHWTHKIPMSLYKVLLCRY